MRATAIVVLSAVVSVGSAQTVQVNAGQTLTVDDLDAGSFAGQTFELGPSTTFEVNEGGAIGPLPGSSVPVAPVDFGGATININAGGTLLADRPNKAQIANATLNVNDGATVGSFVTLYQGAQAFVTGGEVASFFRARDGGMIFATGGAIASLSLPPSISDAGASAEIDGATVGFMEVTFRSEAVIRSGVFTGAFVAEGDVTVRGGRFLSRFESDFGTNHFFVTSAILNGEPIDLALDETIEIGEVRTDVIDLVLADGAPLQLTFDLFDDPTLLLTLVEGPCNLADQAEPFGQFDVADVVSFLESFGDAALAADLAAPIGTLDVADVVTFLQAFGAGCP
ncbi:MAG: hypothetical protein CMJ31_00180 [Phycisphaerae bacterium]|nr:hypothetical protein [Phycisphaerae bacterium]